MYKNVYFKEVKNYSMNLLKNIHVVKYFGCSLLPLLLSSYHKYTIYMYYIYIYIYKHPYIL